jgi:ABC-type multidrug transport system fused ATPase/permease subunit
VGELTSFLVYTLLVAVSLGGAQRSVGRLHEGERRGRAHLRAAWTARPRSRKGGERAARRRDASSFVGVSFSYPTRRDAPVLKGIDLTIAPGEIVAIVGPSGAGKSTLAALLTRLYDPTAGRILLDGHDLRELSPEWLRRRSASSRRSRSSSRRSIAENIRYGRRTRPDEEVEAACPRTPTRTTSSTKFPEGYATSVGERGVQLSGGQKQRVAIARAVLKDPRILVLDEATSALDAESEHLVKEALDRLMQGRTTLIIAHRLSTVRDADRVLVIDGGRHRAVRDARRAHGPGRPLQAPRRAPARGSLIE